MAYYYTLDNDRYFLRWSVGAAFSGCSVLPDSVVVPESLRTCACNVRAYRYAGGVITYDPDREGVTDDESASGVAGKDGISCTHSWNGTVLTVTSASGTSSADLKGEAGRDGVDGKNGVDGKDGAAGAAGRDGVSCTHEWDGTRLIVSSASGTSSADLKGADGRDGVDGKNGVDGKDGAAGKDGVSCTHEWDGTKLTVTSASGTSEIDFDEITVQPDFAQNDETQKDHVKNRTHWAEYIGQDREIVPEMDAVFADGSNGHIDVDGVDYGFAEGHAYVVTWNGVEYECICKVGSGGALYIGNYSKFDGSVDTGEPFTVVVYPFEASTGIYTLYKEYSRAETIRVKIEEKRRIAAYHKLDEEYLPNADCFASVEGGGTALILVSPNGTRFAITIDDAGALWVSGVIE